MKGRDADGKVTDKSSVVTQSPPGSSLHSYGCAVDSCFRGEDPYLEYLALRDRIEYDKKWATFGRLAESHGLRWGGKFSSIVDMPHLEITYGLTLREIQNLFRAGGIESVWAKFDSIRGVRIASEWVASEK